MEQAIFMTKEPHQFSSTLYFDFCGFSKTLPFQVLVQNGKKRATCFTRQVCPKSIEVHPSTIWNCCLRLDSTRKLFASLYLS
ncbi:hypothetical protein CN622_29255 [Bacillus wiedmannii]|nr:hypothetical protein CN646_03320 [Bacillus wiedmannii]PEK60586.1 hypothetical protein CN595_14430 [Bacillus wiedmannii]PEL53256.1 hypothetical protein CN622_29255 [Bacillus wiedmannii]